MRTAGAIIEGMLEPQAYPHAVRDLRVRETHVSWVVLTGDWAYKIKKPVRLEFLDFSTLALRKHYCDEELRLNLRLAPSLYDRVVSIGGTARRPRVDREPAFEYAVRMRQFAEEAELDRRLAQRRLGPSDLRALGERIARFHLAAEVAGRGSPYGEPAEVRRAAEENFLELEARLEDADSHDALRALAAWTQARFRALEPLLAQRKREGWIREGHGDLHLTNLVALTDGITPFDCLEFDPRLRWIDVICDVAFLVMDLELRGRADLAYAFLDGYLGATGDYAGVRLLDDYRVYRSLVRAKVAALRAAQAETGTFPISADARERVRAHLDLALGYLRERQPRLLLMHGYSGSGKSWLAERLAAVLPAIRVRSDVERKRLVGLAAHAATGSGIGAGLYASGMTERTYAELERIVRDLLATGEQVIVDAAFLLRGQRAPFLRLAAELGAPCAILDCTAQRNVLEARIRERRRDASEADIAVLAHQERTGEPLRADEPAVVVRTDEEVPIAALVQRIRDEDGR
jgi:aminoglycoside phosphotransferase family enzyme/predicted kinase